MKLGFLTALFGDKSLDEVLDIIRPLKLDTIEFGTGGYPGGPHVDVDGLLASKPAQDEFLGKLKKEGLEISALSCHGNSVHPDSAIAKDHDATLDKTVKLAAALGVKTVITFSGAPGSDAKAERPAWVTCPWPDDFLDTLEYQWNDVAIPYWTKKAKQAGDAGVRIAFEPHPGFVVYNPETMMKMRAAVGDNLGCNFDPSHFFWQGIDPIESVRYMGAEALFHVHAKDSKVYEPNARVNGVLDTKHYGDELNRAWLFRTCGYGHDMSWWNEFVSTLRMVGYDGPLSIEHEDSLMSSQEGLTKAVHFLKQVLVFQDKGAMTWA